MATGGRVLPASAALAAPTSPSPSPSAFLLPLKALAAAAQHNTILKLKMLLDQPEVVGTVRSELAPAGLKLLDMYYMASWGVDGVESVSGECRGCRARAQPTARSC